MPTIPVADLPEVAPGDEDYVLGVQLGNARKFTAADLGAAVGFLQSGTGAVARNMQDKARESVSILDFLTAAQRADVTSRAGLLDVSAEILAAANYAVANNLKLRAPAGLYMWNGTRIAPTLTNGCSVIIEGDGSGATEFREVDGRTASTGGTVLIFYFNSENITTELIKVTGITVNHRGSESPVDPAGSYDFEQCHCISVSAAGTGLIKRAVFDDVVTKDKIGGGIVFTAGRIQYAKLTNCHGVDYQHNGGQRGDLEFQASIDRLVVNDCTGKYVQSEPNATTPTSGIKPLAVFTNCDYESVDFGGYDADITAQTIIYNDSKATVSSVVIDVILKATGSSFMVSSDADWRRTGQGSILTDCDIINTYDGDTDTISSFYPRGETSLGGTYLRFVKCRFRPGDGASSSTTGYAIKNAAVYAGTQPYLVEFDECEFSSLYEAVIDAYRNGVYVFRKSKLSGRTHFARVGNSSPNYGSLTLDECDLSGITGSLFSFILGSTLSTLTFRGTQDYSKFALALTSGSILNLETNLKPYGVWVSDSAPTGGGLKGMRVKIRQPAAGAVEEYVCTSTHLTAATWTPVARVNLSGSKTHDWADLATATTQSTTVTVTGAAVGDYAEASMSVALSGTRLWAEVTAADTVTVYHRNDTGGNVNVASGTLRASVRKAA